MVSEEQWNGLASRVQQLERSLVLALQAQTEIRAELQVLYRALGSRVEAQEPRRKPRTDPEEDG